MFLNDITIVFRHKKEKENFKFNAFMIPLRIKTLVKSVVHAYNLYLY